MYPALLPPLLVMLGMALGLVAFLATVRPVLRRLAVRQIRRRPGEAVLVVLGSVLGTTLIVASLVVGDSLDRSVRQTAYDVLGPIDEVVRVSDPGLGHAAASRLQALRDDPDVDGLLTVRGDLAAATAGAGGHRIAVPRSLVWEVDFEGARGFGAPHSSGLSAADPGPGRAVLNSTLADELRVGVGESVTVYLYGVGTRLQVSDVVPAHGLAGMGLGASINRNVFVSPGTLQAAAQRTGRAPMTTVLVSNRGDVEGGADLSDTVAAKIRDSLGPLATRGASVSTPKEDVLTAADETAAALGSLFLFIASFSIIAGVLLVVNIFVMLGEERKGQLGILRAIGMRRRRVTGEFALEGAVYAGLASLLGAGLGVLVGRVVVELALSILNSYDRGDNKLDIVFDVRLVSLANGVAGGFLIAFIAVILTSVRIARMNIIAAVRDLDVQQSRRPRRALLLASALGATGLGAASVPALAASTGALVYLLPVLTAVAAIPMLRMLATPRRVTTGVAVATLVWGFSAHLIRPRMFDDGSTATYVVMGTMLSFAAVVLLSQHQRLLLRPLRPLIDRPTESGLAARLAVAYPTARPFRTGATLAMYCIVVLVMVLLAQISAVIQAGVDSAVRDATAGWTMRADFNPATPLPDSSRSVTSGRYSGMFEDSAPLVTATGEGSDPLRRTTAPVPVLAIGIPGQLVDHAPRLLDRLSRLGDDESAWRLVLNDPTYVIVDLFYASTGGPQDAQIRPGSRLRLTDPRTGTTSTRTIAGVMKDGTAFYGVNAGEFRFPVVMNQSGVREVFGDEAQVASLLLRTADGVNRDRLARQLQGDLLANGLVVTDIPGTVRRLYAANTQLFRLMQGYLALGLLVAITGLGVIMVRSVRERRRAIGVLRALGFRGRTVRRAFLAESTFVAVEGVVVGTVLGVLTTWLLYHNSPTFDTIDSAFPIAWPEISLTVGVTLLASFGATVVPARRAAQIRPAIAVRVAE
ncbi:MAG TPA: FtsX-like permease family protein [Nonomuraea sp.]|nr:FtsX-like permease family protein [Nonomuraea sp.]